MSTESPPERLESDYVGIIADLNGNIRDLELKCLQMEVELLRDEAEFWDRFRGWFCINDEKGGG